jgi:hypothetical protein
MLNESSTVTTCASRLVDVGATKHARSAHPVPVVGWLRLSTVLICTIGATAQRGYGCVLAVRGGQLSGVAAKPINTLDWPSRHGVDRLDGVVALLALTTDKRCSSGIEGRGWPH